MDSYARLAGLSVTIDACSLEGLSKVVSQGFERHTTVVRLIGDGVDGGGEDVTYEAVDQLAFQHQPPPEELKGRFSLAEFSAVLSQVRLFPDRPQSEGSEHYRRWAFESAALDLALRQVGRSLAEVLGLEPRPVRFVVSPRLGRPPSFDSILTWLEHDADLRFKLDATSAWKPELVRRLAATGAVETIDFKGAYKGTPVDQPFDELLYRSVIEAFPVAWIEDPVFSAISEPLLVGCLERISWDAPIHSVEDIMALPFPPRGLNVKPSRTGSLEKLINVYEHCARHAIRMYGGGQFELGPGREQIQYLAALFHPDAPNDVAPVAYHDGAPRPALPQSPLPPRISDTGFRLSGAPAPME
jgi:L-alanine-DL-glutamate epimerase-like enolase superfamily enzyme